MTAVSLFTSYKGLNVVPDDRGADQGTAALTANFKTLADRAPFEATSNPTATDDASSGFAPGDQWLNTSTRTVWMCISASVGAAVWKSVFQRSSIALELIPSETTEQVVVAGQLKVTGKDAGGTSLLVSGTGSIAKLENTAASMQLFIDATVTQNESASFQLRNRASTGNDRTLFSRLFSAHTSSADYFNIQHIVGGTTVCLVSITGSGRFVVTPTGDVVFSGANMGNFGIGTTTPKAKLHGTGSTILGAATSAVANGDLGNSQWNVWLDESNNLLMFKAKYSNGTVKSGSVALA